MIVSGFCLRGGNDEDDDLQATRRVVRRAAVGEFMGRDGQDHDEARAREASRRGEANGKNAQRGSEEMGSGNEAQMGSDARNLARVASGFAVA